MTTELSTVRADLFDALNELDVAQTYRHRTTDHQYPAFVVYWPAEVDFRAAMGGDRDFVVDVFVEVLVTDDESSDDLFSVVLGAAVGALLDNPQWDVRPVTDFGETVASDGRTLIGCRIPVAVLA